MDATEWGHIAIALISAAGAFFAGYIAFRKWKPEVKYLDASTDKGEAEAAHVISQAWMGLLQPLREEVASLRARVNTLETELQRRDDLRDKDRDRIRDLEDKVRILEDQLVALGVHPKTRPMKGKAEGD